MAFVGKWTWTQASLARGSRRFGRQSKLDLRNPDRSVEVIVDGFPDGNGRAHCAEGTGPPLTPGDAGLVTVAESVRRNARGTPPRVDRREVGVDSAGGEGRAHVCSFSAPPWPT